MSGTVGRWSLATLLVAVVGLASGAASALFLALLAWATDTQTANPWLLYLLPAAGIAIAWSYRRAGELVASGNNAILEQIHAPSGVGVPLRMFPLILASTIVTHLFGGSAGREGTAVQMGGAIAAEIGRRVRADGNLAKLLLMSGIAGGFAGVFGTPLAATVFAMEVLVVGAIRYDALLPCLVAALASHWIVGALGVEHVHYAITSPMPAFSPGAIAWVAVAGVAFGLTSALFAEGTAAIERTSRRFIADPLLRAAIGGVVVIAITLALGTRAYNGLSLPLLSGAFTGAEIATFAFLAKLLLTSVTLGFGFKGGEVTPLFVIGATLGVTLARVLDLPADLLAALGFVAVFAAAANTPVACVIMGAELFGSSGILYFGIAVFVAYTISGHRGIYGAQRIGAPKHGFRTSAIHGRSLRELAGDRLRRF